MIIRPKPSVKLFLRFPPRGIETISIPHGIKNVYSNFMPGIKLEHQVKNGLALWAEVSYDYALRLRSPHEVGIQENVRMPDGTLVTMQTGQKTVLVEFFSFVADYWLNPRGQFQLAGYSFPDNVAHRFADELPTPAGLGKEAERIITEFFSGHGVDIHTAGALYEQ